MSSCPCGSSSPYNDCCRPYHDGAAAPTVEALMRSRYSAFCLAHQHAPLLDYLINTHHVSKRSPDDRHALQQTLINTQWLKLQVVDSSEDQVEFIATYLEANELGQLHERSRFVKEDGRWFYLDGEIFPTTLKVGRNDPCPCGSGKKYKKCHS